MKSSVKEPAKTFTTQVNESLDFCDFMPFIVNNSDGTRSFWKVEQPSDYSVACALGEGYARLAFRNAHRFEEGADMFLHMIIIGIAKAGNPGGVEIGFVSEVTKLAMVGYQTVPAATR